MSSTNVERFYIVRVVHDFIGISKVDTETSSKGRNVNGEKTSLWKCTT
jgi:hypothetical protein